MNSMEKINCKEAVESQSSKESAEAEQKRLLACRQLVLLVDLDQTLIHTTSNKVPPNLKDVHHFQVTDERDTIWRYCTKVRPHTKQFLQNMSSLYNMQVWTLGTQPYAEAIAEIIDPQKIYFKGKIVSREDFPNPLMKCSYLKTAFPCGDAMVAMIDDRCDVWRKAGNFILVDGYNFFDDTGDVNAPTDPTQSSIDTIPHKPNHQKRAERIVRIPVTKTKEENIVDNSENVSVDMNRTTPAEERFSKNEALTFKTGFNHHGCELGETCDVVEYEEMLEWADSDDYLIHLQSILRRIYSSYYKTYGLHKMMIPHTKIIVPHVRRNILRGKNILLTGVEDINRAHMLASELGATIQPAFIPPGSPASTTHVVAGRRDTEKVYRAALCRTVPIVNPEWLQACSARWERVEENAFVWRDCLEYFRTVNLPQSTTNTKSHSSEILDSLKRNNPGLDGGEQKEEESKSRRICRKRESADDCSKAEKMIKLDDGDSH